MTRPPSSRNTISSFGAVLALLLLAHFWNALRPGRVLSPADVVLVQQSFTESRPEGFEPDNRLLIDPVLQFEPWLAFARTEIRAGRWPLWNPYSGFGAPFLANGQSAILDPFHLIAYLGSIPEAFGWMAVARLWVAGLGMFLLARGWGLSREGCWLAGLCYPFCGFLMTWLLYPLASASLWLPWLLLASDRLLERPGPTRVAAVASVVAISIFAGQVQAVAHNLLAAGAYVIWRILTRHVEPRPLPRATAAWALAVGLGIALASIQLVPLADYLKRSPVWDDRVQDSRETSFWRLPRLLDTACTALPYAYGSQRRGHPNLARALGVHNLNESVGGFVGLTVLCWLAPLGWVGRCAWPRARFLAVLGAVTFFSAFEFPPFVQILRVVPVLNVIDHRRMTHLTAFSLILLAAHGISLLSDPASRRWARWLTRLAVPVAALLLIAAAAVPRFEAFIRQRALSHYVGVPSVTDAAQRAERQVHAVLHFTPAYLAGSACLLLVVVGLSRWTPNSGYGSKLRTWCTIAIACAELFVFGYGLNPSMARGDYLPQSRVIDYLRRVAPPPARILALDEELPPNMLMRYGLFDVRNYDSIELGRIVEWLEPLHATNAEGQPRSSRREIDWQQVARWKERLAAAGVRCVGANTEPPAGVFAVVERVAGVWIAHVPSTAPAHTIVSPVEIRIDAPGAGGDCRLFPIAFDPGWRIEQSSGSHAVLCGDHAFLAVRAERGTGKITLKYDPPAFRIGLVITTITGLMLAGMVVREIAVEVEKKWTQGLDARTGDG